MQVTLHRYVLAEFNTHRLFSRSSASSRAIPVWKQIERIRTMLAEPVSWPCEQAGMQGGAELQGQDLQLGQQVWRDGAEAAIEVIENYMALQEEIHGEDWKEHTLHKSVLNRIIEPYMWHTLVVTSTEWKNFFFQRAMRFSPLAQPEFRAAADLMLVCLEENQPYELDYDEWHLPYTAVDDRLWLRDGLQGGIVGVNDEDHGMVQLSAARCARTSHLNQEGVRDPNADLDLYQRLASARPMHAAPMEMPCTPAHAKEIERRLVPGNFQGYHQHRHQLMPHSPDHLLPAQPPAIPGA